jgi:hypothetical protein
MRGFLRRLLFESCFLRLLFESCFLFVSPDQIPDVLREVRGFAISTASLLGEIQQVFWKSHRLREEFFLAFLSLRLFRRTLHTVLSNHI